MFRFNNLFKVTYQSEQKDTDVIALTFSIQNFLSKCAQIPSLFIFTKENLFGEFHVTSSEILKFLKIFLWSL